MKTTHKRRGILASLGAIATATALALSGAAAAQAAPVQPAPASSTVTITKLSQPDTLQSPATGEALALPSGATPIAGVVFEYYLVDDTAAGDTNDIGTNAGQQAAATWTAATAPIQATATGEFDPTTALGETTETLPRGLYVVKEISAPAGVTPAADFLLAVPLTNPTDLDEWLNTIYVYPKNAQTAATKTVDQTGSLIVGSDVTWTIETDIPRNPNPAGTPDFVAPDAFEIHDSLTDDELVLSATALTPLTVTAGGTPLVEGALEDYTVTADTSVAGTTTYKIIFTSVGRAALATAVNADPDAVVTVDLVTTVKQASVIGNVATVYPSQASISDPVAYPPLVTDTVEVKYGSYQIVKKSTDVAVTDLSGAEFRVYETEADALLANANYLEPVDNAGDVQNLWTTDASGNVTIEGLRYTAFYNGAVVASGDTGFQTYWLVETKALDGHQLLAEPIEITIDGDSVTQTTQEIVNQSTSGAFVLPLTGGTGTLLLTLGGIAILATVLIVARRRRSAMAAE